MTRSPSLRAIRNSRIGGERYRRRIAGLLGCNEHWDKSARRIIGITSALFAERLTRVLEDTQTTSISYKTLWMHMLRGSCDLIGVRGVALICAEECLRGISVARPLELVHGYIGTRIQRECLCLIAKRDDPEWFAAHSRLIRKAKMKSTDRMLRDWTTASGALLGVRHWSSRERTALARFLVLEYSSTSGTCGILSPVGGTQSLVATPAMTSWLSDLREENTARASYAVPLLEKPPRWPAQGLENAPVPISHPMIRPSSARSPGIPLDMAVPEVENALNALQETPFRINKRILEVMETFIQHEDCVAFDFSDPKTGRKRVMAAIVAARGLDGRGEHFYGYHADYRGRVYPEASSGLHWQGAHPVKALLEFSRPERIPPGFGGRFAQIGAALAGIKGTHDELEGWVETNRPMIIDVARDPYSDRRWMAYGRDSFLFLAWSMDFSAWMADPGHESRLIASRDATQSGFQICALLARDAEAAALVNATPADRPVDLYMNVLEELRRRIPLSHPVVQAKIALLDLNRKEIKRLVIPIASSSSSPAVSSLVRKMFSFEQYEAHGSRPLNQTARWVSRTVREILEEMTPGAMGYLKWAAEMAVAAIDGRRGLEWTSPSGVPVKQYSWMKNVKSHAARALPANFVQSIDAALLVRVVNATGSHIATAHDCYGVHIASLEKLESAIEKSYTEVFSEDLLLNLHGELASQMDDPRLLPEPFALGSLDTSLFAQSKYAFS